MYVIIIILAVIYWCRFKIYSPFWSKQPVVHNHNLILKLSKPQVIWNDFYIEKFMNTLNIKTTQWHSVQNKKELEGFIGRNFYREKNGHYSPSLEKHITPYYEKDYNAYVSSYYLDGILAGCIFNRTLRIHLSGKSFNVSYIDYLCVHKGHRKKNVAPELIQTHEHFQRTESSKKYMVSMFKKEGRLHGFRPLVKFTTSTYSIPLLSKSISPPLPSNYEIVCVSLSIKNRILGFLEKIRKQKQCFVIPPFETIIELIERKSIQVYAVADRGTMELYAMYFFRKTGLYVNSIKETVECFASMFYSIPAEIFCDGFFKIIKKYLCEHRLLHLEGIGSTSEIASTIKKQGFASKYDIPCAYYLYNYSNSQIPEKEATIIL